MMQIYQKPELLKFLPAEVKKLFAIFGSQIRLVGGCVRDMLLQKKLNDFDFATPLLPQEVIEILENQGLKAIPTGVKFGTVTAVVNGKNFEITTLRKDVENDGRHAVVEFVDDYFFDASRRDFTINALYLDSSGLVYDYFDGIADLENQKVKFIGDANERIKEDYLRILRFFRFSCKYALELDLEGLKACVKNKDQIKFLSADRVRGEVFKVLSSTTNASQIRFFQDLENSKIASEIFNSSLNIENFKKLINRGEALNIKVLEHLRFFSLLEVENLFWILERFNFSNQWKKYFEFLHETSSKLDLEGLRLLLAFKKKEWVYDFYLLNSLERSDFIVLKSSLEFIENFILPDFPLDGNDLMELGFKGKEIGVILENARIFWAKGGFIWGKKELLEWVIK